MTNLIRLLLLSLVYFFPVCLQGKVLINEAMPCNLASFMDKETYNYCPYVELFNDADSAVALNGYTFVYKSIDDDAVKTAAIGNDTLPAGGYLLFFFDKETTGRHVGYKMDADGGSLSLFDSDGALISELQMPAMCAYVSYGYGENGVGYMEPTPAMANDSAYLAKSYRDFTQNYQSAVPVFSERNSVIDADSVTVSITCATSGANIYYTTNGTEPTQANGSLYTGPLTFRGNAVVRARAYAAGKMYSPIATRSFVFNDEQHSYCSGVGAIPIVSLVTDMRNFEDDTIGIGVVGVNGTTRTGGSLVANYNQDWKRPVNFEYIVEGRSVVNNEVEAETNGGPNTRSQEVKSLSLSLGKKCGTGKNKVNYAFFSGNQEKTKIKSLQLRNGGNRYDYLRFRDGFLQSLTHNTSIDYQAYQPVGYYINGDYKGLMLLNEHTNEDYMYTNYGLDDDEVDLIKVNTPKCGDIEAYNHLLASSAEGQDDDGYYEKMNRLMDMEEYMVYTAFEQFIGNVDWPGNNLKAWRCRKNGRFRWILYDTDSAFGILGGNSEFDSPTLDMLKFCMAEGDVFTWANGTATANGYVFDEASEWKTELFRNLMKNSEFRNKFLTRYLLFLEHDLKPETVVATLDSIAEDAYPEYCAMHATAGNLPILAENDEMNVMKTFAQERPDNVRQQLADYFGGELVKLNVISKLEGTCYNINGLYWDRSRYEGSFVTKQPFSLTAIAPAGYTFSGWKVGKLTTLLDASSLWNYKYDGSVVSEDWKTATDSLKWNTGKGKFGYGPGLFDTKLNYGTDVENKPLTGYFRTTVKIGSVNSFDSLVAKVKYNDAYILYINGKEVSRSNIEAANVTVTTTADKEQCEVEEELVLNPELFVAGDNVVAAEVHQVSGRSSDFAFALELKGIGRDTSDVARTETSFNATLDSDLVIQAIFERNGSGVTGGVMLNEICTSNKEDNGVADEYGNYGDWVELYNSSDVDVNVAGWYVSDNVSNPRKYQIPTTCPDKTVVPAHGHCLIWCDGDVWNGPMHVGFKLSESSRNSIVLSREVDGSLVKVDQVVVPSSLGANNTYGRATDGAEEWKVFASCEEETDSLAPSPLTLNGSQYCLGDMADCFRSDNKVVLLDRDACALSFEKAGVEAPVFVCRNGDAVAGTLVGTSDSLFVGVNVIDWQFVTANDDTLQCSQQVELKDIDAPVIDCEALDTLLLYEPYGSCGLPADSLRLHAPMAHDNCGPLYGILVDTISIFAVGETAVNWLFADVAGNEARCTQQLQVADTMGIRYELCDAMPEFVYEIRDDRVAVPIDELSIDVPSAIDNCGEVLGQLYADSLVNLGYSSAYWVFSNNRGDWLVCHQVLKVVDSFAPYYAECNAMPMLEVDVDSNVCEIPLAEVRLTAPIAIDNGGVWIFGELQENGMVGIGENEITWRFADTWGNETLCRQRLKLEDKCPPVFDECDDMPAVEVGLTTAACDVSVNEVLTEIPVASDNCNVEIAGVLTDNQNFYSLGEHQLQWRFTDAAGNELLCAQQLVVQDSFAPYTDCSVLSAIHKVLPENANTMKGDEIDLLVPTAVDNCGAKVDGLLGRPEEYVAGDNVVVWSFADESGNQSQCTQVVHLEKNFVVRLSPNPVRNVLVVQGVEAGTPIEVNDALGRKVEVTISTGNPTEIYVASWADGIYFVNIEGQVYKLMKVE